MRKGGTDLFMCDGKYTSAENKDANRDNYMEPDTGQLKEVVDVMVQVVVTEGGKQGIIMQEKVDVEKSTPETEVINQHEAVEEDIDKETAVARTLYEEIYSYEEVIIKNTTEKVETKDTGQYYDTHDMIMVKDVRGEVIMMSIDLDRTASWEYYVRLDSRSASKVYGVQPIVIYIWVKEVKVLYYRKFTWDRCKF